MPAPSPTPVPTETPTVPEAQEERVIRSRKNTVAAISLRRIGGKLSLSLKSELLHTFVVGLLQEQVNMGNISASNLLRVNPHTAGAWDELPLYSTLVLAQLREACGQVSFTARDSTFVVLQASVNTEVAIRKTDAATEISLIPLISPNVLTGEAIPMIGLFTTKQMQLMVKGWRMFIENIHRQHSQSIVVGATVTVEEFFLPAELEKPTAVARA